MCKSGCQTACTTQHHNTYLQYKHEYVYKWYSSQSRHHVGGYKYAAATFRSSMEATGSCVRLILQENCYSEYLMKWRSRDRFPVVSLGIFFRGSPQQNHAPWGWLSLWKWVPGISPGVKATGVYGWRPTTLVGLNVKKIRGLNLPRTPSATSACLRDDHLT